MEFVVPDVIQGIKGFRGVLEHPWVFDVWESEQQHALYAQKSNTRQRSEINQTDCTYLLYIHNIWIKGTEGSSKLLQKGMLNKLL